MCARRFLFAVFFLILLVVAGAFAIYQWGGNVLLKQATPQGHFAAAKAGAGPDYALASNWVARPGTPEAANPALWLPRGVPDGTIGQAAVFFIHPTTYLQRDRWNAPIDIGGDTEMRTRLFVRSQASAFNGVGEIWAPHYRQAAYGAFLLKNDDANKALDLAYGDVLAAFDRFLIEAQGRPIILAGHSQGSLHLLHLLVDRKDELKGRLVAAYVAGWPVGVQADLPATGLAGCDNPDQVGCVLSWQSFGEPANTSLITGSWSGSRGFAGIKRTREDMLCVNPITGRQGGKAAPNANIGSLIPDAGLTSAVLEKGRVGAECRDGFLNVSGDIPSFGPFVLPGNNYHVFDYGLFWANVRQDAARRLTAWQKH